MEASVASQAVMGMLLVSSSAQLMGPCDEQGFFWRHDGTHGRNRARWRELSDEAMDKQQAQGVRYCGAGSSCLASSAPVAGR